MTEDEKLIETMMIAFDEAFPGGVAALDDRLGREFLAFRKAMTATLAALREAMK